jgi:catechol 2,3-dioxygenase-like lactoylglutathione lyase family enzyme
MSATQANDAWPEHLPVTQVRYARATNAIEPIVRFYRDALGLRELYRFEDHAGFDGVMLGLPGTGYHLEFTRHADIDVPAPSAATAENLLVLYVGDHSALAPIEQRMAAHGFGPVEPGNPFWRDAGAVTFEDPDGWRVVVVPDAGL